MTVETLAQPMAKKRGRPAKGRNDITVRIDAQVARQAKVVAELIGKPLNEYLSEILAPVVARDVKRQMGKLAGPGEE